MFPLRRHSPLAYARPVRSNPALLALALLALALAWTAPQDGGAAHAQGEVQGDVNCDANVNAVDSLQILRDVAGLSTNAGCLDAAGDVDCSGAVNAVDGLRILRHIAGLANAPVDSCPAIGESIEPLPLTADLIAQALAAGDITEEQAVMYQVFADFGDPRLPEQFRGAMAGGEMGALRELAIAWDSLPAQTQEALRPFTQPPSAAESWYAQRADLQGAAHPEISKDEPVTAYSASGIQWQTASGARVKVWWHADRPQDEAKARAVLNEVENVIWDKLVDLMGDKHAPFVDVIETNNGGDDLFDIYFVNMPLRMDENGGEFKPEGYVDGYGRCEDTSAYMVIDRGIAAGPGLYSTIAHEFMHAVQFTFDVGDCGQYRWLMESTATWAQHFVYPNVNDEHGFAVSFLLDNHERSLNFYQYGRNFQYGAYLWFFFLQEQFDRPEYVRDVWNNSANPNSLAAIEAAIGAAGGFDMVWPKFALNNWNQPPIDNYRDWDALEGHARVQEAEVTTQRQELKADVPYLGAAHHHFTVKDPIKWVRFDNTLFGVEGASVWAFVKKSGAWQDPEDWTGEPEKTFCRDLPGQDVTDIVIVVMNLNWQDKAPLAAPRPPAIEGKTAGCDAYEGTTKVTHTQGGTVFTAAGQVRFEFGGEAFTYETAGGTVTYTVSGEYGGPHCSISGMATHEIVRPDQGADEGDPFGFLNMDFDADIYVGGGVDILDDLLPLPHVVCPDYEADGLWPVSAAWFGTGDRAQPIPPDPSHLFGDVLVTIGDDDTIRYEWDLRAAP